MNTLTSRLDFPPLFYSYILPLSQGGNMCWTYGCMCTTTDTCLCDTDNRCWMFCQQWNRLWCNNPHFNYWICSNSILAKWQKSTNGKRVTIYNFMTAFIIEMDLSIRKAHIPVLYRCSLFFIPWGWETEPFSVSAATTQQRSLPFSRRLCSHVWCSLHTMLWPQSIRRNIMIMNISIYIAL